MRDPKYNLSDKLLLAAVRDDTVVLLCEDCHHDSCMEI